MKSLERHDERVLDNVGRIDAAAEQRIEAHPDHAAEPERSALQQLLYRRRIALTRLTEQFVRIFIARKHRVKTSPTTDPMRNGKGNACLGDKMRGVCLTYYQIRVWGTKSFFAEIRTTSAVLAIRYGCSQQGEALAQ